LDAGGHPLYAGGQGRRSRVAERASQPRLGRESRVTPRSLPGAFMSRVQKQQSPPIASTQDTKSTSSTQTSSRAQMIDTLRASADPKDGRPLGRSVSQLAHLKHELKKMGVDPQKAQQVLQQAA